jgi:Secretion system C-terminal sorting domain
MKSTGTILTFLSLVLVSAATVLAQATGDYRTPGTGLVGSAWSSASTWQTYNGSGWVNASTAPSGSETITLQAPDSVNVDVAVTISGVLVSTGGVLVNSETQLTFGNGGVYVHAINAGSIPRAIWSVGSTCRITGTTASGPSFPSDIPVYNVEVDLHEMTGNCQLNMTGTSLTINGDFRVGATVSSSGSVSQLRLSGSGTTFPSLYRTYYIAGDLIMDSTRSLVTTSGSGTANTGDSVYIGGDVVVNGGELSLNRGSGASAWFFCSGNFFIAADARMTRHSSSVNPAVISFSGTAVHAFTNDGTITSGYQTPIEMSVESGAPFNTGLSQVNGGINFTLQAGATLRTARDGGVDSAIACFNGSGTPVTITLDPAANFVFDGSAAQLTGLLMPSAVNDLTINNSAGVTLSQATTINGVLHLVAGVFDNTIPFALGPSGSISYEGGSLLIPVSVKETSPAIPTEFYVNQNYPNPFNPSTTIQFGIPTRSLVTAKVYNLLGQEVATLFNGQLDPGTYESKFDATHLGSGMYLCRVQAGNAVEIKRMVLLK